MSEVLTFFEMDNVLHTVVWWHHTHVTFMKSEIVLNNKCFKRCAKATPEI